ncbi:hypothetical protein TVNIR_0142 [Thioalkalivibrio nitratireducens DSM 14787]|uniref:Uncharacterized protein n=1 Tax=Thioalkalivibrio nitratireducens (strain DSM 14787 / UNIQEM 213 / ALEN2) TaxID=1255043 RepID=L0DS87_THIND|nr:hypothetical protein [Thioalkalivibrio nitratireducens]AGA31855.1 hypothetical protein TVNIR_0142 [Thioalkalivibrio nitratireducens DSM 14787]
MKRPAIRTALPQRRYKIGDFSAVVLGEIESDDGVDYRYVCALVQDGSTEPGFYVLSVRSATASGDFALRVLGPDLDRELDVSGRWRDLDAFCEQAISLAQQVLRLEDEQAHRLL